MPKVKCCDSVKLRGFVQEFGEQHFSIDGKILFCKLCEVRVMAGKCFPVQHHCDTIKHRNSLSRHFTNQNRQWLLFKNVTTPSPSNKTPEFSKDLCEMMVSAQSKELGVQKFLWEICESVYSSWFNTTKNYLSACYEDVLRKIRQSSR
jgi:hypothetical protein